MHAPFPSTIAIKHIKQAQLPFAKSASNLATVVGPSPSPSPSPPPEDDRMDMTEEAPTADATAAAPPAAPPAPVSAAPPAPAAPAPAVPGPVKGSKLSKEKPQFIFNRAIAEGKQAGTKAPYTSVAHAYRNLVDAYK